MKKGFNIFNTILEWFFRNAPKSPKATQAVYVGDHIANLAAQPPVSINPIGEIEELNKLPIWLSLNSDDSKPKFYPDFLWEVEPFGEYLYYLAGDFTKNEKGLLNFTSPSTLIFAEVNFEDDVINVEKSDGGDEQAAAEYRIDTIDSLLNLSVGEVIDFTPHSSYGYDDRVLFVSLNKLLPKSNGYARLVVNKPQKVSVSPTIYFIYEEFRGTQLPEEHLRYTKVYIKTSNRTLKISDLLNTFISLVSKYNDMPYVFLSGATRG